MIRIITYSLFFRNIFCIRFCVYCFFIRNVCFLVIYCLAFFLLCFGLFILFMCLLCLFRCLLYLFRFCSRNCFYFSIHMIIWLNKTFEVFFLFLRKLFWF